MLECPANEDKAKAEELFPNIVVEKPEKFMKILEEDLEDESLDEATDEEVDEASQR